MGVARGASFRTRYAVVGAVAAIGLGAGGFALYASADSSGPNDLVLKPTATCRLFATNPGAGHIGARRTPIGAAPFRFTVAGKCGVPAAAQAVDVTVTVISATSTASRLTVWPSDAARPALASITSTSPKAVVPLTVKLSAAGALSFHASRGRAHIAVDVTGFWVPHDHDERYYTRGQLDGLLATPQGLKGPTGDQGAAGPAGPAGPVGDQGSPGPAVRAANLGHVARNLVATTTPVKMAVGRDGLPVFAYADGTAIRVVRCADVRCANPLPAGGSVVTGLNWSGVKALVIGADGFPTMLAVLNGTLFTLVDCNDGVCAGGDDPIQVLDTTDATATASLAIGRDANPVMVYYSAATDARRIRFCADPACNSAPTNVAFDAFPNPAADPGAGNSLAIGSDGLPIVAYLSSEEIEHPINPGVFARFAKLMKCTSALCATKLENKIIDPGANVEWPSTDSGGSSIVIGDDGLPLISYQSRDGFAAVAHCNDLACAGNFTVDSDDDLVTFVDQTGFGSFRTSDGRQSSLTIGRDGLPVVSFATFNTVATDQELGVVHCAQRDCSGFNHTATIVDDVGGDVVGQASQLAIGVDGLPIVMHWNATTNQTRVVHCSNVFCLPNVRRR